MSLKIIKAGVLDTIQDSGRYGHQHLGINPGGAMDRFAASLANALLGKNLHAPVIEVHFPASQILFQKPCIICLGGADFTPTITDVPLPVHQPIFIPGNSTINFKRLKKGARIYLSILNELKVEPWLNSYSTNLKAATGGHKGREFQKGDEVDFETVRLPQTGLTNVVLLPWKYNDTSETSDEIEVIAGNEWSWLTTKSKELFFNQLYTISSNSDRMGYRLVGLPIQMQNHQQLISSAVSFGTIQLPPSGGLIILMADHQTTGGYPRIAHVSGVHLSKLAQMNAGEKFKFVMTTLEEAEKKWVAQQQYLMQLQKTCNLKMQNWLHAN